MNGEAETLDPQVATPEEENRGLRELVEELEGQLEELGRRVAALEGAGEQDGDTQAVDPGDVRADVQRNAQGPDWRPPRRSPGMPAAGVVTLEEQPGEGHAAGPLLSTAGDLMTGSGRAVKEIEVDEVDYIGPGDAPIPR